METCYLHHRIMTAPRAWKRVSNTLLEAWDPEFAAAGGTLYGIWRAQIGRPRDELTAISVWSDPVLGGATVSPYLDALDAVQQHTVRVMVPTLRPQHPSPPRRQGNYAFRYFATPSADWDEFLALCASAWPGFEASFDSQVIGLWRFQSDCASSIESLLLTRRPNLAMWERSKIPSSAEEAEIRATLSRRYDLCTSTVVYTSTLLTATDVQDLARWA